MAEEYRWVLVVENAREEDVKRCAVESYVDWCSRFPIQTFRPKRGDFESRFSAILD